MTPSRLVAAVAAAALAVAASLWCRRRLGPLGTGATLLAAAVLGVFVAGLVALPDPQAALEELASTLGAGTYYLVAAMTFLETGAFVGLVAPGDFTLLVGGAIAAQGEVALLPLLALAWLGALLGDSASFWLGRRYGRAALLRHGPRFRVTPERLQRVERYFVRWGGWTIVVGRFIGLVRAVAPFLAGASRMPYGRFLPLSLVASGPWAATYVLLGFFFYRSLDDVAEIAGFAGMGLAAAVALAAAAHHLMRRGARARGVASGQANPFPAEPIQERPPRPRADACTTTRLERDPC